METKVLLFGAMGEIGPVVHESLISNGVEAYLVPFAQNVLRDEAGYRRELTKAIETIGGVRGDGEVGVRILVVAIGCPTALARMKQDILQRYANVIPIVEDAAKVELLDSKLRSYEYFLKMGVSVPQRYQDADDVPCGVQTVFKRDSSFASHGVRMPADTQALRNLIAHHGNDGQYLIQERIYGTEYSVDAVRYPDGRCICGAYQVEKTGGSVLQRTPSTMPTLDSIAASILESLDYKGICGFDFIVAQDGTPYLLEANPRLTGGISVQISSGFDIPRLLINFAESLCSSRV